MHFSRPRRRHAPFAVAPAMGGGGKGGRARTAISAAPPRGGGGLAWGSCGRSGRHALGRAAGASCVQRLDDSRNSAIHTTYRISLRSSSLQEPRYPLLRVVCLHICGSRREPRQSMIRFSCVRPPTPPLGGGGGGRFIERPRALRHGGGGPSTRRGRTASVPPVHPVARPTDGPGPDASPAVSRLRHGGETRATAPPGAAPRVRPRFA